MFSTEVTLFVLKVATQTTLNYSVESLKGPYLDYYYFLSKQTICLMFQIFFLSFADDAIPVPYCSNFDSLMNDANAGLSAYSLWFRLNKLSFNKKKNICCFQWQKITLKVYLNL